MLRHKARSCSKGISKLPRWDQEEAIAGREEALLTREERLAIFMEEERQREEDVFREQGEAPR
jgi:hypothetical protein